MRILITGAGGQLGLEWIEFCRDRKLTFLGFSSKELNISEKARVLEEVERFKPDVLVNCAAYTAVDTAEEEPENAFRINEQAVADLAMICKLKGIKLVHYSTDYVFSGSLTDKIAFKNGYSETHLPQPVNVYGASKLAGERAVQQSGCDYLIIRTSWLCGRYGRNFVKTMLKLVENTTTIRVVDDQYGCPSFTANVVENTHILLMQNKNGIFNISSSGLCSWFEFAREIFDRSGIVVEVKAVSAQAFASKAKRPAFSKLDTKKLSTIEGTLIIPWRDGLAALLSQIWQE